MAIQRRDARPAPECGIVANDLRRDEHDSRRTTRRARASGDQPRRRSLDDPQAAHGGQRLSRLGRHTAVAGRLRCVARTISIRHDSRASASARGGLRQWPRRRVVYLAERAVSENRGDHSGLSRAGRDTREARPARRFVHARGRAKRAHRHGAQGLVRRLSRRRELSLSAAPQRQRRCRWQRVVLQERGVRLGRRDGTSRGGRGRTSRSLQACERDGARAGADVVSLLPDRSLRGATVAQGLRRTVDIHRPALEHGVASRTRRRSR